MFYEINKENLTIISGPYDIDHSYIKIKTNCGNPELLNLLDYGFVPAIRPNLSEYQMYGETIVYSDKVEVAAISRPSEEIQLIERKKFKESRQLLVDEIKVTTQAGNTFDGDEISQTRMTRAIIGLAPEENITWVLADNSVVVVSKEELVEALRLAGRAQENVWVQ